jgi:hypothetical protein
MNKMREDRKNGVAVGHAGEKSGEREEDFFPLGGKSEKTVDLKKYYKMF